MVQHQIAEMYLELDAAAATVDRFVDDWVGRCRPRRRLGAEGVLDEVAGRRGRQARRRHRPRRRRRRRHVHAATSSSACTATCAAAGSIPATTRSPTSWSASRCSASSANSPGGDRWTSCDDARRSQRAQARARRRRRRPAPRPRSSAACVVRLAERRPQPRAELGRAPPRRRRRCGGRPASLAPPRPARRRPR